MKFCENCHCATEQEYCPLCGTKKLRQVKEDDFCLLTESSSMYGENLISILEESGIPCSAMPYGSGLESRFAMPLSNYRIFVPFSCLEKAKNIVLDIENSKTDELRGYLLENQNQFNISGKLEKKIRKKIKLTEEQDFFLYCLNIIKSADKIADNGMITSCLKGGHYLFCYSDKTTLALNSKTLEILSLTVLKNKI